MDADIPPKPLVFISASHRDVEWRERLKKRLDEYSSVFEWWDDSRLDTGDRLQKEINAAIEKASVAVILISEQYLNSPTTQLEFRTLLKHSQDPREPLRLFPILLENCNWTALPGLSEIMLWGRARPLAELVPADADEALRLITAEVLSLALAANAVPRQKKDKKRHIKADISPGHTPSSSPQQPATQRTPSTVPPGSGPDVGPGTRPFVLIDHFGEEEAYSKLVEYLGKFAPEIEWWNESKIIPGDDTELAIEAAMQKAHMAVLLISEHYLRFNFQGDPPLSITSLLIERDDNIRLFPVLVEECGWRSIPRLRDIKFASHTPLKSVEGARLRREVEKIARAVRKAAFHAAGIPEPPPWRQKAANAPTESPAVPMQSESTPSTASEATDESPSPRLSGGAVKVMIKAMNLAESAGLETIAPRHILIAFAEEGGSATDSAGFLREQLKKTGRYAGVFEKYIHSEAGDGPIESVHDPEFGKLYVAANEALKHAEQIALRTSGRAKIHERHLLASLLSDQTIENAVSMRQVLADLSVDLGELRQKYREFTSKTCPLVEKENWPGVFARIFTAEKPDSPAAQDHSMSLSELLEGPLAAAMSETDKRAMAQAAFIAGCQTSDANPRVTMADILAAYLRDSVPQDRATVHLQRIFVGVFRRDNQPRNTTDLEILSEIGLPRIPGPTAVVSENLRLPAGIVSIIRDSVEHHERGLTPYIFACLLGPREWRHDPVGMKIIESLEIDLPEVRRQYFEWMRVNWRDADLDELVSMLDLTTSAQQSDITQAGPFQHGSAGNASEFAGSSRFTQGHAGYASEFCGVGGTHEVVDKLNVEKLAHRLADLVALRETRLPLAIGLFGNWGSGKSHFMNLMDRRLKFRADKERNPSNGAEDRWCREIVPVYFNAWHYLDADLWASLVSQIFQSLATHLNDKPNAEEKLAAMRECLAKALGATALAEEEVSLAEAATESAKAELKAAENEVQEEQKKKDNLQQGITDTLKELLPGLNAEALKREALKATGIEKELKNVDELQRTVEDARTDFARLRALWRMVSQKEGMRWRAGRLIAMCVIAPIVFWAVIYFTPGIQEELRKAGEVIAPLLAVIGGAVRWLRPYQERARAALDKIERWHEDAEAARRMPDAPAMREAKEKIEEAKAKEAEARAKLDEAKANELRVKGEVDAMTPERRLGRFIEERVKSEDYRGRLGLVSLARRDFEKLSAIFTDLDGQVKEVQIAKVNKVRELGKIADEKERTSEVAKVEKATEEKVEKLENLSKSVDRIVLFVDDLDRCQPEKVVDVLQAVHLLLAFPLFAVVVGVDQRCLKQSLRMQFKGLLGENDGDQGASPLDYLEKIFHVPFQLPPMNEQGFRNLIDHLTIRPKTAEKAAKKTEEAKKDPKAGAADEKVKEPESQAEERAGEATPENPAAAAVQGSASQQGADASGEVDANADDEEEEVEEEEGEQEEGEQTADVGGDVQPLDDWEIAALKEYHALLQTPRSATRLLNTYRLLRAGVEGEWEKFKGDTTRGEFQSVMLLLAVAAGHPAQARDWFAKLRAANSLEELIVGPLADDANKEESDINRIGRQQFIAQLKKLHEGVGSNYSLASTADWVERVERFAF